LKRRQAATAAHKRQFAPLTVRLDCVLACDVATEENLVEDGRASAQKLTVLAATNAQEK
jgi:hypothetical protein